jgi:hypothetical protein
MGPRILTFIALVLLALPAGADAQAPPAEQRAILEVIDRFMHAVTSGDPAAMASVRLEGTTTTMERPDPAGGTMVQRRPFPPAGATAAANPAASPPAASAVRERYWDPVVQVRGSLAVVWTPYEFWRDGKTTHCGVDVFELVKQAGAWKIGNVMYTVEPDACPVMRPKDAARVRPTP